MVQKYSVDSGDPCFTPEELDTVVDQFTFAAVEEKLRLLGIFSRKIPLEGSERCDTENMLCDVIPGRGVERIFQVYG